MKIVIRTPGAGSAPRTFRRGYVAFAMVACVTGLVTYAAGAAAGLTHGQARSSPPTVAVATRHARATVHGTPRSARAATSARRAAAPSASAFADDFVGVTNRYARAHGDPRRVGQADCVQAAPGRYMCSYVARVLGTGRECHIMQARWTPRRASSITVTLAGRSRRCGSLREALRSLR